MFAMIYGIVYVRSRENMAMIEKGFNPRNNDVRPRPFINLKWGLLLMGSGLGLLLAYIIDHTIIKHDKSSEVRTSFTIGGHHTTNKNRVVVLTDTGNDVKDTSSNDTSLSRNNSPKNNDTNEDEHSITEIKGDGDNPAIYFALIAIGGGLGLYFSYRIEKKEWLDKKIAD
jgi:hypothetical protein